MMTAIVLRHMGEDAFSGNGDWYFIPDEPEFAEDEEDDVEDLLDEPWDHIVAQQELEDFEQADEYFDCCDDGDF